MSTSTTLLNELLDPVGRCLTADSAKRIAELRATPEVQARIETLASKANEGTLSAEEQSEYEAYVSAGNFIAVLQSKARKLLNAQG